MRRSTLGRMLNGRTTTSMTHRRRPTRWRPTVAELEERTLLSLTIRIDYSYDTLNFFNTQAKRDLMQLAANALASHLDDSLLAINPSGQNTWEAVFPHPGNGQTIGITNLVVPANTFIIYVGGSYLSGGSEAGEGSTGGYSASGDPNWLNTVEARGQAGVLANPRTDFANWGGSITFDASGETNWYFGESLNGFNSSQTDFLSVAQHEVAHVLGLGTADSWYAKISGGAFRGSNAIAVYGQPVPVNAQADHWAQSVRSDGNPALMTPVLTNGTRGLVTTLDLAALKDIGWQVNVTPPTFQFSASSFTTAESAGIATITVTRTGGVGAATVNYSTSNGTATAGSDYTAASGTLSFGHSETSKTFTINIANDDLPEGIETVNLVLASPTGGAILGSPATAFLRIVDSGLRAPVDFDPDARTDMTIFRPSTAQWFARGAGAGRLIGSFGAANLFDIPVPGDYDGDGVSEMAVFRPSTAQWFVMGSTGGRLLGTFGATNLFDIPAPGDYDGDGRTDLAVFRPSTAQWFVRTSTGGRLLGTFGATNLFDIPAPGDYDGDGVTEMAVFRPSTAQWFARGAAGGRLLGSFGAPNLADIPVPGDYDGDGVTDLAVFRVSTAQWFARGPSGDRLVGSFGAANLSDVPAHAPIGSLGRLGVFDSRASRSSFSASARTASSEAATTTPILQETPPSRTITWWRRRRFPGARA
ncbi:MAG: Calx-beta domain-containing protein [Isosphaeraceae bacterium]